MTENPEPDRDRTGAALRAMYMVVFIVLCVPSLATIASQETRTATTADCRTITRQKENGPVVCHAFDRVEYAYRETNSRYGKIAQERSMTALTIIILTEAAMVLYDAIIGPMKRRQLEKGITIGEARGEAKGIARMQEWLRRKQEAKEEGRTFDEPMPGTEDGNR